MKRGGPLKRTPLREGRVSLTRTRLARVGKRKKGAADAKKGKIFSKLIKEITIAARLGGGDVDSNPRLRTAVEKGRAANMPNDNVSRAIAQRRKKIVIIVVQ